MSIVGVLAPGRINLIGEHIDYNGGLVLPAAIDLGIAFRFKKNGSRTGHIYSKNYGSGFTVDLDHIAVSEKPWHNYFLGVIHFIHKRCPDKIHGFDCVLESTLPIGAGVSSSAALECGFAAGLNRLFQIGLTDMDMITLSRDAEHQFVGTNCGIMDQFAVVKGKKGHFICLDCEDLSYEYVPASLGEYTILLMNSNVSHELATSAYNQRRSECEQGLAQLQLQRPEIRTIAQASLPDLRLIEDKVTARVFQRMAYVVQEQQRTKTAIEALRQRDMELLGQKMYASHKGLRDQYEVSCTELDFLVDLAETSEGVLGARLMGGGFGGCTINLVHKEHCKAFVEKVSKAYGKAFGQKLDSIPVALGDGVRMHP